ncbi:TRAP transporter small permease [Gelria sp. Kuro-4]|uniref:TRAP transporter small permease n=1 Tax=Gelria sp. Kuro-4 TaxID=2796927 RepID=UPI001C80A51B|nr:TRAP transporter small permease [Gelria sp. Kuro-4]
MTKLLNKAEIVLRAVLGIALCIMTASVTWQVVLRYVFGRANVWSEELARFSFVWLVMLGSSLAIRSNRHMSIDFIKEKMSPQLQLLLSASSTILCMVFVAVIGWQGLQLLTITSRQLSGGMRIPMAYPYLAIPVGSLLMLVFFTEYLLNLSWSKQKER